MYFKINYSKCQEVAHRLSLYEKNMKRQANELEEICLELKKIDDDAVQILRLKLQRQAEETYLDCRKINIFFQAIEKIMEQYRNTDISIEESGLPIINFSRKPARTYFKYDTDLISQYFN